LVKFELASHSLVGKSEIQPSRQTGEASELGVSVHFLSFRLKSSKKLRFFYFKSLFLQNSSVQKGENAH
jgi:hypothetical protein